MAELSVEKITLEISNSNDVVILEVSSVVGGGSGASIDDSAGLGVFNKTWSANKIKTEISKNVAGVPLSVFNALESKVDINTTDILNKVDKEAGKGLSDENFTQTEKTKLASVGNITRDFVNDYLLKRG